MPNIEPLSRAELIEFIAFCKAKPKTESYNFGSPFNCALSQYAKEAGKDKLYSFNFPFGADRTLVEVLCPPLTSIEFRAACTFGALALRLEALL